jgi:pimeloyl-ACP methyl ester carboxylesterase
MLVYDASVRLTTKGKLQMKTITSKDGTPIAFEQSGKGPAIIMVVGAFNDRTTALPITQLLEKDFTVLNYDRRGRGDSGDTAPYTVEREIEDIEALIREAGGSASVFGYSSGAILGLKAAAQGLAISKLAMYEPPPVGDYAASLATRIAELVSAGQRGDAVELFQREGVGIPVEIIAQIRKAPFWPSLEQTAHTLVYEMTILSSSSLPGVTIPTLVLDGGDSPAILHQSAQAVVNAVPTAQHRTLPGQNHDLAAPVLVPLLHDFFTSGTIAI